MKKIKKFSFNLNLFWKDKWESEKDKLSKSWPDNGQIKFNDFSVRYRDDLDFVLKNINCEIKPSEKVYNFQFL